MYVRNTNYLLISKERIKVLRLYRGIRPHLVKVNITVPISPDIIFQIVDIQSGMIKWLEIEAPVLEFRFQ